MESGNECLKKASSGRLEFVLLFNRALNATRAAVNRYESADAREGSARRTLSTPSPGRRFQLVRRFD